MNKINIDDLAKKNLFKVPDQYFEQLPAKIQLQLNPSQKNTGWLAFLTFNLLRKLSLLLIVCITSYAFFIKSRNLIFDKTSSNTTSVFLKEEQLATNDTDKIILNNSQIKNSNSIASAGIFNNIEKEEILLYIENMELEEISVEELN